MDATFSFVADAANADATGKLNVLGIFGQIRPSAFPYLHPSMFVIFNLTASASEFGRKRDFEISLMDPDGHALQQIKASSVVPKPESGGKATIQIVLQMVNTPFPKPGPYSIDLMVGDDRKAWIPLDVVATPKPKRRPRSGK